MKNETKTKEKLIQELETLRVKIAAFEKAEAEHKRTEDELRKSEERFRKIFEYSNDAIFIFDPERDKIIDVNPRACDKLEYSREELLSMPITAIHPKEMPELMAFSKSVLEQGEGWTNELSCLTKSRTILPAEISASVIEIDGKPSMIALVRDITERKQAERVIQAENERKTRELEEARKLQLSMLPETVPKLPNLDIAVYSKPATEVGGDYYDFHMAGDGTLTIAIGDATGHGLNAGTMVGIVKGLFMSYANQAYIPDIFKKLSRTIECMNLGMLYMAMTLIKFKENKMKISAAGMPPAFVFRADSKKLEEILIKGPPLGGFPDFPYKQEEIELRPGDALVLMSDGLPERFNDAGETLDYPGAKKLVEEVANQSPQTIIDHLVEAGEKWSKGRPQDDDVTFVVIKNK